MLSQGIAGLLGPNSPSTSSHVQSVCDSVRVPHLETKWDFRSHRGIFAINLYPHPDTLSRAYEEILNAWGWDRYAIIYENNDSLVRLQNVLKASNPTKDKVTVIQMPETDDYRPMFKELRGRVEINSIIIDCDGSKLSAIFEHASQVNMMKNYRYFITSLDIHTVDIASYLVEDTNITAFRMLDRENPKVYDIVTSWESMVETGFLPRDMIDFPYGTSRGRQAGGRTQQRGEQVHPLPNGMLKTETALIYDAIELYARGLQTLDTNMRGALAPQAVYCNAANGSDNWKHGQALLDTLKKVQFQGLSGTVELDDNGFRSDFALEIMEHDNKGLRKIGIWNSRPNKHGSPFEWTRTNEETLRLQEGDLKNKTLIVSTKESSPYLIKTNDSYEGYAIDLLDLMKEKLGFNYVIQEVPDNSYGVPTNDSKWGWTGVIREILSGRADIGIGDMTITHIREKTLDFTMPFMNLGISILYSKPKKEPRSLFSFLEPFHYDVWVYMATAYLGVSLILFILARLAPEEWQEPPPCSKDSGKILENQFTMVNSLWFAIGSLMAQGCDILPKITPYQWLNPHPCKSNPDELENDLNLSNALWHNWGSIMQQGSDIAPKAASTRTVAGIWWFFTLIMISSYTANLAAFLTKEGMEDGVKSIEDLPKQTKVKYGSIGSGSTFQFFKDSTQYKEVFLNMQNMRPKPFVSSNKEGVERVKNSQGTFAFFMESSTIEYQVQRDCSLMQLGGMLDSKGYGIALRKNSKYRDAFNNRILELQETGELEKLKVRWWQSKEKGGGQCDADAAVKSSGAEPLTLGHVGGVFVVLLGGCALACVMAFVEFMWKSRKLAGHGGDTFAKEVWKELRFALQCQGDTKPVRKNKVPLVDGSMSDSVPYSTFEKTEPTQ